MKISELAEKYGISQGEILRFLRNKGVAAESADMKIEEGAVKLVSDKFEARHGEEEEKVNNTPAAGSDGKKAAENKAADNKAADNGKKPVKKKKIIIVTGGTAQSGQRGAYSSGSGAYNPGGTGRAGASRGGNRSGGGNAGASGNANASRGRQ